MAASRRSAFMGLVGAALLLTTCVGLLIAQAMRTPVARLEIDRTAPPIDVRDSSGKIVSLLDLRDRVVVLFFSSAQCPVSAEYAQRVATLASRYSTDNVVFLRVETQCDDASQSLHQLPLQTLYDQDGALAARYNVKITPTFFVISPRGQLRYSGAFDDNREAAKARIEYCRDAIQSLLNNEAVATTSTSAFGTTLASPK